MMAKINKKPVDLFSTGFILYIISKDNCSALTLKSIPSPFSISSKKSFGSNPELERELIKVFLFCKNENFIILKNNSSSNTFTLGSFKTSNFITAESTFGAGINESLFQVHQ